VTLDLSLILNIILLVLGYSLEAKLAHVTLYHDDAYKSYLELPVGD